MARNGTKVARHAPWRPCVTFSELYVEPSAHQVIDSISRGKNDHTDAEEQKAGQITTPYKTIHSMPTTDTISTNEIRFIVSTTIGKGALHAGVEYDGKLELNLKF